MAIVLVEFPGLVSVVRHQAHELTLAELTAPFAPDPFCLAARYRGVRPVAIICNDLAGRHHESRRPGYGLTFVRPWDGSPIFGPLLFVGESEGPDGLVYTGLREQDLASIVQALLALGYRMAAVVPPEVAG
jgi:hypothetical protein